MKYVKSITPFFILASCLLAFSVLKLHLLDFWTLEGGSSLVGLYALGVLLTSSVLFVADWAMKRYLATKRLWWLQLIITTVLILAFIFVDVGQ